MTDAFVLHQPGKEAGFPVMLFFSVLGHFVAIVLMIVVPKIFPGGEPQPFGGPGGRGGMDVTWVNFGEGRTDQELTQEEPAPARSIKKITEPDQMALESKTELPDPSLKKQRKEEPTEKQTLNQPQRKLEGPFGTGKNTKKNSGISGNQGMGKSGIGTIGAGGGPGSYGTGTGIPFPFPWYIESVMTKLELSWVKPYIPDPTPRLYTAIVYFVIDRNGEVKTVRLEKSSGVPALDRSAESAVYGASPFPPLPGQWHEPELAFRIQFIHTPQE